MICSTSGSSLPSSTMSRRAQVQRCPADRIGRLDDGRGSGFQVLHVPHDDRIVAAQLERQDLVRRLGELLVERACRRATEPVNSRPSMPGCAASALPCVRPADQQPDRAFGHAGFVETFDQEFARRRRLLRRLEDHRIAGDQRGDDVAVGQMRREVDTGPSTASTPCGLWRTATLLPIAASSRAAESAPDRRRPKSRPCR